MILGRIVAKSSGAILALALITCFYTFCHSTPSKPAPVDPGVRGGPPGAGGPLKALTADETAFFLDGQARFAEVEVVANGSNNGLGPASIPTSASPAIHNRVLADRARRRIHCPMSPF